jgi:hypothetical protein
MKEASPPEMKRTVFDLTLGERMEVERVVFNLRQKGKRSSVTSVMRGLLKYLPQYEREESRRSS